MKKNNLAYLFFILLTGVTLVSQAAQARELPWDADVASDDFSVQHLRKKLMNAPISWPSSLQFNQLELLVDYTINPKLMTFIKELLQEYRSDFTSVVVMDNLTGNILAMMDYSREKGDLNLSLTYSGVHPSASLFKIVTSADLLESGRVNKETSYRYLGKSTTLYKYQLRKRNQNFWMREESFMEAFAKSNNVIFGKAAMQNTSRDGLLKTAQKMGFYDELMEEVELPMSTLFNPANSTDEFELAELASGFNRETVMSPVHGALLSQIVANDGFLRYPKFISQLRNKEKGEVVWRPTREGKLALDRRVTESLREMMELTVNKGTAKRVFRGMKQKVRSYVRIGGKTGSLTGGEPFGRRDWFTAFAIPYDKQDTIDGGRGISICVMNVNVKKWYVKATFIAKKIIEYYYESIYPGFLKEGRVISKRYPRK